MKDKCSNCNIWFVEQNGDNWFFLLFIDRGLFIFPIIVGYYFNMRPEGLIALCLHVMREMVIFLLVVVLLKFATLNISTVQSL